MIIEEKYLDYLCIIGSILIVFMIIKLGNIIFILNKRKNNLDGKKEE